MKGTFELSFEFFPPKTAEGDEKLRATWITLSRLKPHFFSVTYGAGGSTQEKTAATAVAIRQSTGIDAAPHLSCIGSTQEHLRVLLQSYKAQRIQRLIALRGDLPAGMESVDGEIQH